MAMRIRGIRVCLFEKKMTGTDPLGNPVFEEEEVFVDNVLVAPTSFDEAAQVLDLTGKRAVYTLGIPKGDDHDREGNVVSFFGRRFRVFSPVVEGIEDLIPLDWNRKVMVEYCD